jgi:hypothetical protein
VADGSGLPEWLTQLGAAIVPALGVLGFMVNRRDKIVDQIDANDLKAMKAIESARLEASEALTATIDRFDSRHEAIRREIASQVGFILERVNSMSDTMVRRSDIDAVNQRFDGLNLRIDKVLDQRQ